MSKKKKNWEKCKKENELQETYSDAASFKRTVNEFSPQPKNLLTWSQLSDRTVVIKWVELSATDQKFESLISVIGT